MAEQCPCCLRAFEKMQDYPRVFIRRVERLPLPEFIDYFSEEAARLFLQLSPAERQDPNRLMSSGINRTPEIAVAYHSQEAQDYIRFLESHQGREIAPVELAPHLTPHKFFRRAYPIPGTRVFLSLSEGEPDEQNRVCQVVFHGEGPSMGSNGGRTLQMYGAIAAIHYEGRLVEQKVTQ